MTSLALVAGFVGLFGFVIWLGLRAARKAGEIDAEAEAARTAADHAKKALAVDEATKRADPDALRDELRAAGRE